MKTLFTITLTLFLGVAVFASPQIPDEIIYKGKKFNILYLHILESYFKKHPDKISKAYSDCLGDILPSSTGLNRGYIATHEIKNNQLFLQDIRILSPLDEDGYKSVTSNIFPNKESVKIDWFTGILVLQNGEYIGHVHGGYGSTPSYEKYILLEIRNGNLIREIQLDLDEFEIYKEKQFQIFKQTKEYEKLKLRYKEDDEYMHEFIIDLPEAFPECISIIVDE